MTDKHKDTMMTLCEDQAFHCEPVSFMSDGFRLTGILHLPPTPHPSFVVGSHGLLSNADSPKQITLANHLNRNGIAYFRFHHRGCGESSGTFDPDLTFHGRTNDLTNAITTIINRPDMGKKMGLFGSSMGGASVIAVAERFHPQAMVILAAPVSLSAINTSPDILADLLISDTAAFQRRLDFDLTPQLDLLQEILIVHGKSDQVVPFSCSEQIFASARPAKKLLALEKGDHQISSPPHQSQFIREAVQWFTERLV